MCFKIMSQPPPHTLCSSDDSEFTFGFIFARICVKPQNPTHLSVLIRHQCTHPTGIFVSHLVNRVSRGGRSPRCHRDKDSSDKTLHVWPWQIRNFKSCLDTTKKCDHCILCLCFPLSDDLKSVARPVFLDGEGGRNIFKWKRPVCIRQQQRGNLLNLVSCDEKEWLM